MRLINADAFIKDNEEIIDCEIDHPKYQDTLRELIDQAPTIKTFTLADIVEQYRKGMEKGMEEAIPHGEWIYHAEWELDGECAYECSQCGMGSDVDYDFCMGCGADMRKQKEGEEK